jgi:hypothetical protein
LLKEIDESGIVRVVNTEIVAETALDENIGQVPEAKKMGK